MRVVCRGPGPVGEVQAVNVSLFAVGSLAIDSSQRLTITAVSPDLIERLSDLQIRRPWVPLLGAALVTAFFGFFASRLDLETRYDALLPGNQPSVRELHRVQAKTATAQTMFIL